MMNRRMFSLDTPEARAMDTAALRMEWLVRFSEESAGPELRQRSAASGVSLPTEAPAHAFVLHVVVADGGLERVLQVEGGVGGGLC
eukprot:COSAG04_NODE_11086_length_731_cov_3.800633_1_plen_85_part_01